MPADLVISNLQHEALAALLERKVFKGKRWLIFSGLMRSQARDVGVRMEKHGLRIVREWDHEMTWYTLLVQNPKSDGFVKSP